MRIQVDNFLGVERAEMELVPGTITVVSGTNAAGKSSFAAAVSGALAHDANPLSAGKGGGNVYLRDDKESGGVQIDDGDTPLVRWQAGTGDLGHFTSEEPLSTAASLGLFDFLAGSTASARAQLWEDLFLPPFAEMKASIQKQLKPHIPAKVLKAIMENLDEEKEEEEEEEGDFETRARNRIDLVAATYRTRARDAKADWTKVTGEAYGVRKAADWLPDGWVADLDGLSTDQTDKALTEAREALQSHHVGHAVSVAEVETAKAAAQKIPEATRIAEVCEATQKDTAKRLDEAQQAYKSDQIAGREARAALEAHVSKEPRQADHLVCPHCKNEVVLRRGELAAFDVEAHATEHGQWAERRTELQNAMDGFVETVKAKMHAAEPLEESNSDAFKAWEAAKMELAILVRNAANAEATVESEEMVEAVREAEGELERSRTRHDLVGRRTSAMEHHANVVQYTLISDILGPKGVRATAMETRMASLDQTLESIAKVTGWPRITVSRVYAVAIGKRTLLRVCSRSERLCAQYSLQIAVARCIRDTYVVLDDADTLVDGKFAGLRDLMAALRGRPNPPAFLVCGANLDVSTLNPDGLNYLIDNGVMRQLEG